jgi:ABC-2 type transport system permease protein
VLAYLKFEARRLIREPRTIVLTLVLPLLIYAINSGNAGTVDNIEVAKYLMVSMAAYGGLVGVLSVCISVSLERSSGWLRLLRITPLKPGTVILTKALLGSLLVIPAVAAVGIMAVTTQGVHLSLGQWAALIAVLWIGSLPFAALGLAFGFWLNPQLTQPVTMLTMFGLSFLGGLFLPVAIMPEPLQKVATWLPSNRYGELGWSIVGGKAPSVNAIAILVGWTVLFGAVAMVAYRRQAANK